jgi:GH15 family glucan-1,4-alpha-glucosidase
MTITDDRMASPAQAAEGIATTRTHGYAPIADYAALGDGRTVALVARDGRIDWWPTPTLDAPPLLAAILDPARGGHFLLAPRDPFTVERSYLEGTNVLRSVYTTRTGTATVVEALNTGRAGRLPWTELVRRIEGNSGSVTFDWQLAPGDRFRRASPWMTDRAGVPVATVEDQAIGVIVDGPLSQTTTAHEVSGAGTVSAGQRALLAVVVTDNEPLFIPGAGAIEERLEATISSWRRWSDHVTLAGGASDGRWDAAVRRSALALKTLIAEHTGAIAAAATTSLPEGIGGTKNWDYRYSWVRDSSFALDALINLGLHEEVHGAVSWLLGAIRQGGGDLHVFYSLGGAVATQEHELDVPGYRHSRPVRSGNSAIGQLQLGTYGDLFDTIYRYCNEGHLLDPNTGRLLAALADSCCDQWHRPDSGIWELNQLEHYTISKIGCWVALDRAARLADAGQLPSAQAARWRTEAEEIRAWVNEHCWSEHKRAYTFYAGTDALDAAVLLAGRTGFEEGERLTSTIEAVIAELSEGPLLYRYSGMRNQEGAFVACTFWLVDALARTGQIPRAAALMDDAVALTNDVGLLAEQIDPATGAFLGNVPQGLSHLALINAASTLRRLSAAGPTHSDPGEGKDD